jgi:hypothetical protein
VRATQEGEDRTSDCGNTDCVSSRGDAFGVAAASASGTADLRPAGPLPRAALGEVKLLVNTQVNRVRRGHDFYPPRSVHIPTLGSSPDVPLSELRVSAHYFGPSQDWWVVELDRETGLAFGFADLGLGQGCGEWGNFFLPEIEALRMNLSINGVIMEGVLVIERDCHWSARRAGETIGIVTALA